MSVLRRFGSLAAIAGMAAVGVMALPSDANAWWRYRYGARFWVAPPVVVVPPVYAPPPVVYAPPPYYYYGPPRRAWVPPHWEGPYWVPGHWY
jgi:hypothetical protein